MARHPPNALAAKILIYLHLQRNPGRAPKKDEASFTVSLHFRVGLERDLMILLRRVGRSNSHSGSQARLRYTVPNDGPSLLLLGEVFPETFAA
jgi:hypothetical protein